MKLRNKRTGEKAEVEINYNSMLVTHEDGRIGQYYFDSLKDLEEWEDYEEPEIIWYLDWKGRVQSAAIENNWEKKSIGNYFETKEEAEKAVEKLKAMAKLKEFGFRFIDWELDMKTIADGKIWFDVGVNTEWDAEQLLELKPEAKELLDILFGGEK